MKTQNINIKMKLFQSPFLINKIVKLKIKVSMISVVDRFFRLKEKNIELPSFLNRLKFGMIKSGNFSIK